MKIRFGFGLGGSNSFSIGKHLPRSKLGADDADVAAMPLCHSAADHGPPPQARKLSQYQAELQSPDRNCNIPFILFYFIWLVCTDYDYLQMTDHANKHDLVVSSIHPPKTDDRLSISLHFSVGSHLTESGSGTPSPARHQVVSGVAPSESC